MFTCQVHVIGASGRLGSALMLALGVRAIPVVRDAAKWATIDPTVPALVADLNDPPALVHALGGATAVVSCAHARHTKRILDAAPPDARLFFLGSTRKFTRWPDDHGNGVLAGEAAFLASGRSGVMLHPTMIYGARGEDNVQRLASLLRKSRIMPLPVGGRALVQPVHQSDVTRAILAALAHNWAGPHSIIVAGPGPLPYWAFVRAVAAAAGLTPPKIMAIPVSPLIAAAAVARFLPGVPRVEPAEVRRLLEDKAFDIAPMRDILGVSPMPMSEGLALTFGELQRQQTKPGALNAYYQPNR